MKLNYIHNLQDEVTALKARNAAMEEGLLHLFTYLTSDKFADDPTVQVADVLRRINVAREMANSAETETENECYRKRCEEATRKEQERAEAEERRLFASVD